MQEDKSNKTEDEVMQKLFSSFSLSLSWEEIEGAIKGIISELKVRVAKRQKFYNKN